MPRGGKRKEEEKKEKEKGKRKRKKKGGKLGERSAGKKERNEFQGLPGVQQSIQQWKGKEKEKEKGGGEATKKTGFLSTNGWYCFPAQANATNNVARFVPGAAAPSRAHRQQTMRQLLLLLTWMWQ